MKRPYGRTAVMGGKKTIDPECVRYVGANEFGHTHSRTYSDSKSPFSRSNVFRSRLNPTLDPLMSVKLKHNLAGVSLHGRAFNVFKWKKIIRGARTRPRCGERLQRTLQLSSARASAVPAAAFAPQSLISSPAPLSKEGGGLQENYTGFTRHPVSRVSTTVGFSSLET